MKNLIRLTGLGIVVGVGVLLLSVEFASGGRGRGGGGGGRGGGGGGRGGGGMSRPSGGMSRPSGGVSRPSGGVSRPSGGVSRPGGGGPSINRSPGVSAPKVSQPIGRGPGGQPGGGLGARGGPGVVTSPKLQPGTRPSIGQGPSIGGPKIGGKGGIGDKGIAGKGGIGDKGIAGKGGIGDKGIAGKGGIGDKGIAGKGGIGDKGIAGKGGIGDKGVIGKGAPGIGQRPGAGVLPGLGLGLGAGVAAGRAGDVLGRRQEGIQDRRENIGDRSENLQNRLDDRQDFRNQSQQDRQDYLNNRREDWQNWHDDYYGHHDGWYHGGWCDHWGDAWSHMWSDHTAAMVLGTTMWGLNRMSYWFGYGDYSNPYYSEPLVIENTTINYSEPLAAPPEAPATVEPAALPPGVTQEGMTQFEAARTSFYDGNYAAALQATNKALASMPKDAVIHEFRALTLFALGKYRDSATTLHPVLAVGPGWDWTTLSSLYADADNYTKQLRALETYVDENPKSADGHFVLAYHYLIIGQPDRAAKELDDVQKLVKNDTVTAQLLKMLGKSPAPESPAPESDVKIDAAKLIGTWKANRGGKANFELTMDKDKGFTWVYREGNKKQEVKGAYAVDGNVLALEPDAGGVMLAEITDPQNGSFVFKTVGAPKNDPGLRFKGK